MQTGGAALAIFGVGKGLSALGEAAAAEETGLSTFRQTRPGETFQHYGYAEHADKFAQGLRPGSYATSVEGLSGAQAQSGLALPHANPPNAVYTGSPEPGTWLRVNPIVRPDFGQPGGLPEYYFPNGTGAGTISGPTLIP